MSKHKYTDRICIAVAVSALILTLLFISVGPRVLKRVMTDPPYAKRLFDTDKVHTLDIVVKDKDWKNMLENAMDKEYIPCSVVIDGESVKNVAIRPKGSSSLLAVSQSDSDRISFKLEFDHYEPSKTYHGLDKLALNNLIQDNTYLMDHIVYDMMRKMGVSSPLTSFIWITVNGSDWGLYLGVEGIEDAFARRNYGNERGNIYKPDVDNLFGMGGEEDLASQKGAAEPIDGALGAGDVSLLYNGDDPKNYANIFNNSVFGNVRKSDKHRLIQSLKKLNEQKDLSDVLDINEILRYFAVHNFTVNGDSYTGTLVHNYYLHEQDGKLSMLPWDYNLSFGGMLMNFAQVGNEAVSFVNAPIDMPVSGGNTVMQSRPMVSWIFSDKNYKEMYHQTLSKFITEYFESGYFDKLLQKNVELLSSYVKKDPTAFASYDEFIKGAQTLKNFCGLRAKSIRGQLNGTIPSTIEGQEASPDLLIDASSINLSDMTKEGDIGGASAAGDAQKPTAPAVGNAVPEKEGLNDAGDDIVMAIPEDSNEQPGTAPSDSPDSAAQRPSKGQGENINETLPDNGDVTTSPENVTEDSASEKIQDKQKDTDPGINTQKSKDLPTILLLLGSFILLIGGLLFAKFYK